jgi:hypothetical protein
MKHSSKTYSEYRQKGIEFFFISWLRPKFCCYAFERSKALVKAPYHRQKLARLQVLASLLYTCRNLIVLWVRARLAVYQLMTLKSGF